MARLEFVDAFEKTFALYFNFTEPEIGEEGSRIGRGFLAWYVD